jgi:glycosyltransferase involved in cell wall biosynthesis
MISIVIPVFNRVDLISFSLRSIEGEKFDASNTEVIVVDDGSTDGCPDFVESNFPWVKLIRNNSNQGGPVCRNQGLEAAAGEFVLFMDSDDLIEKDFFLFKLKFFDQFPEVAGIYGPWDYFKSQGEFQETDVIPRHSRYPLYPRPVQKEIIENILAGWFIPIHAIIWRTKCVKEVGGFRSDLLINQDVDFCFRMLVKYPVVGVPSSRALIRMHDTSGVGALSENSILPQKLNQILSLREGMVASLRQLGRYNEAERKAVANYCFEFWAQYRTNQPEIARRFLQFSKNQYPHQQLKGTFGLRALAFIFGAEQAVKIKQWIGR